MTTASTPICASPGGKGATLPKRPSARTTGSSSLPALGELVDPRAGGRRQRAAPHDPRRLELAQALGEDVGADVGQSGAQVGEALGPEQQLADDEQRPALADDVERPATPQRSPYVRFVVAMGQVYLVIGLSF